MSILRAWAVAFLGVGVSLVALGVTAGSAWAEWRRTTEIELNTAFTQEAGSLKLGLFAPLSVGVTDSLQASIHPLLLLVGQTSLGFRVRLTPVGGVTAALNLGGTWSFIAKETRDGRAAGEAAGDATGFPGTLQITETTSVRLGGAWLLSGGAGFAADFLGTDPIRGLVELHFAVHFLPAARHLVMLQVLGYLPLTEKVRITRPSIQALYAWSVSPHVQLALGVGVGEWAWTERSGRKSVVRVFPLVDAWFQF